MDFTSGENHARRPIFLRWRFWALIAVLAVVAWYLNGYFAWRGEQAGTRAENILAYTTWKLEQQQQAALETAYKADPYGGATPEETLELFIEALEKKDYDLASKYFVVEKQEENLKGFSQAEKSGGMAGFINAYRNGRVVPPEGVGASGIYEMELFEPGANDYPFRIRLIENKFTSKWKILEL